jgi:hypothetical protein
MSSMGTEVIWRGTDISNCTFVSIEYYFLEHKDILHNNVNILNTEHTLKISKTVNFRSCAFEHS